MSPEQLKKLFAELRSRNAAVGDGLELRATADGSLPQEFLLIPIGKKVFNVETGYGENFTAQHAAEMVANFARFNAKPFFDLDHCSIWGETAAYAWVTAIEARADGIWATGVEWLDSGKQLLQSGTYRYFSPAWYWNDSNPYSAEGEHIGCRLISVALTNTPQYYNADNLSQRNKEIRAMDFMAKLKAALGLPTEATEEQVLEAVAALKSVSADGQANANKQVVDAVRSLLGLKADADQAAVEFALNAKLSAAPADSELRTQLKELQDKLAARDATEAVDKLIAARKVLPGQREQAIKWASRDLAGFQEYHKNAPELAPGGPIAPRKVDDAGKPVVTDVDRELAKRTGQKAEELAATRHALETAQG